MFSRQLRKISFHSCLQIWFFLSTWKYLVVYRLFETFSVYQKKPFSSLVFHASTWIFENLFAPSENVWLWLGLFWKNRYREKIPNILFDFLSLKVNSPNYIIYNLITYFWQIALFTSINNIWWKKHPAKTKSKSWDNFLKYSLFDFVD